MKRPAIALWFGRAVAVLLVVVMQGAPAQGDDLAALAKKEKERRAKVSKPVKVLTEDDSKEAVAKGAGSVTALEGPSPSSIEVERQPGSTNSENQKSDWKSRADAARTAIVEAQKKLEQMEKELAVFRSDLAQVPLNEAQDPLRLQKREVTMDAMRKQIEVQKITVVDSRKALAALEDEARKAGVPAGWLR